MEEKHKQIIQEKTLQLRSILSTKILDVAIDLLQNDILTASIFKDIVEETSDKTRAKIFLLYIPTCGPKAFDELYKSVTKFELSAAAELLKPETKHGSDEFQHGIVGENSKDIDLPGNSTDSSPSKIPSLNSDKNELPSQKSISVKASRKLFIENPLSTETCDNSSGDSRSKSNNDTESLKKTSPRIDYISQLRPNLKDWCIKARVNMKSEKKEFPKKNTSLFDFILTDKTGEIKCTGFKKQILEYYDSLKDDEVYYFSKCKVISANKQFSPVKGEYELNLTDETVIKTCTDDPDVPGMTFDFVKISDLSKIEFDTNVDVIGIVTVCKDFTTVSISGKEKSTQQLEFQLRDESGMAVNVTLWGNDAPEFKVQNFQIIAVKGAKLKDFKGRYLSVNSSSQLVVDPKTPDASTLRSWFVNGGRDQPFSTIQ